jgi:hypothetical protein
MLSLSHWGMHHSPRSNPVKTPTIPGYQMLCGPDPESEKRRALSMTEDSLWQNLNFGPELT